MSATDPGGKTRHGSREISWDMVIRQVDPDRQREMRNQQEYEFSNGRRFFGDPDKRGPYSPPTPVVEIE